MTKFYPEFPLLEGSIVWTMWGKYEILAHGECEKIMPHHFRVLEGDEVPDTEYAFKGFILSLQQRDEPENGALMSLCKGSGYDKIRTFDREAA